MPTPFRPPANADSVQRRVALRDVAGEGRVRSNLANTLRRLGRLQEGRQASLWARDAFCGYRRDGGESHIGGAPLAAEIARLLLVGDTNSASVRHGFLVLIPLDMVREARTVQVMRTVIETPTFQKQAEKLWSEDERLAFIDWDAANPLAGGRDPWGGGRAGSRAAGSGVWQGGTQQHAAL